jgi:hypothetical protein
MATRRYKTKFLAVFLIAFVCLNAGGAVCVAFCRSFETAVVEKDHCPLSKKEDHCKKKPKENQGQAVSLTENAMDCCPLTVSFFAAPVETRQMNVEGPAAVPAPERFFGFQSRIIAIDPQTIDSYRGPPKDRRPDRIKNCILRI